MAQTRHIYETYIRATPEQIWQALIDPEFTARWYFGTRVQSGWEPGAGYEYLTESGDPAIGGEIVEIDPPRRLVMTFSMLYDADAVAEPASRVTWQVTAVGDVCRLTLIHGDLTRSPKTWQNTATGWPLLLAAVKTLLETGDPLGVVVDDGGSPHAVPEEPDLAWHRAAAMAANNGTYDLLDDVGSSPDHDDRLLHQAHASAYHWAIAGTIEHRARAEYLCSRVYAYLGRAEPALHHAERCAALVEQAGLADWDLAFAREASARALACAGDLDAARIARRDALSTPVADPEDRELVESELAAGPWFGLVEEYAP